MYQDSDNKDYKNGRVFVFDDKLEFDDDLKHQLEGSFAYSFEGCTTIAALVNPGVLTAEKKCKPDGTHYILVRRATFSEQRELSASDDEDDEDIMVRKGAAGADADEVAIEGLITRSDVHKTLAFFIDIEPEPEDFASMQEYTALMSRYRDQIEAGNRILQTYGRQITVQSLSNMRKVYYSFTNDPRYLDRSLWVGTVTSVLSEAWHGIGPWQR